MKVGGLNGKYKQPTALLKRKTAHMKKLKINEYYIETYLYDILFNYISVKFIHFNDKERNRLLIKLLELYLHIDMFNGKEHPRSRLKQRFMYYRDKDGVLLESSDIFNGSSEKRQYLYSHLLKILMELNLVITDGTYLKGHKCKRYSTTDILYDMNISSELNADIKGYIKVSLREDIFFINDMFMKSEEEWISIYPEHKTQIKSIFNIEININQLQLYLESKKGTKHKDTIIDDIFIRRALNEAINVNQGNIWIKETDTGRLYNSITNMVSILRDFISIKGDKSVCLKELDIKNNQPLLLNSIMKNDKFRADTENGLLYENIMNGYEILFNKERSRDRVKKDILVFLFNENLHHQSNLDKVLEYLYGNEFISSIKALKSNTEPLWSILQRAEADIFINSIRVLNLDFYITIHDSIIIKEKDHERVMNYIIFQYINKYNVKPTITTNEIKMSLEY